MARFALFTPSPPYDIHDRDDIVGVLVQRDVGNDRTIRKVIFELGEFDETDEDLTVEADKVEEGMEAEMWNKWLLTQRTVRFRYRGDDGTKWKYGLVTNIVENTVTVSEVRNNTDHDVDIRDICVVTLLVYGMGVAQDIGLDVWGSEETRVKEGLAVDSVKAGGTTARAIQGAVDLRSNLGFTSAIRCNTVENVMVRVTPQYIVKFYAMHVFRVIPKTRNFVARYREFLGPRAEVPLPRQRSRSSNNSIQDINDLNNDGAVGNGEPGNVNAPNNDRGDVQRQADQPDAAGSDDDPIILDNVLPAANARNGQRQAGGNVANGGGVGGFNVQQEADRCNQVRNALGAESADWQAFWNQKTATMTPEQVWELSIAMDGNNAAISSLVKLVVGAKSNKLTFKPTQTQQRIHQEIVGPQHLGKLPMSFLEEQVGAREVQFKPEPGVLIRLFDFRFERWGLTVTHMEPMNAWAQREWKHDSTTNLTDFSAKISAPAKPRANGWAVLVESMESLVVYGEAFYNARTLDLLRCALRFVRNVKMDNSMFPVAPDLVRMWVDEQLARYREQIEQRRVDVAGLCALLDVNCLAWIRESQASARRTHTPASGETVLPSMARSVVALIPKENGKSLCLKSLSRVGCDGKNGGCFNDARAHFVPTKLPQELKDVINERYGGLKDGVNL